MIMPPITRSATPAMISSFPIPFWRLTASERARMGANSRQTAAVSTDFAVTTT